MPIRKYKPTSAGRRFQTVQTFDDITASEPYKPLVEPIRKSGGRHPVSPWGVPTKGYKTRNRKVTDRFIVQRRTK